MRCSTGWAKIYIAGPLDEIEQVCRFFALEGACVTVTPTRYIYTGGEETGVEVGMINYPRFPMTQRDMTERAVELGKKIMIRCHQLTFTVMTPENTTYYSRKEELGVR